MSSTETTLRAFVDALYTEHGKKPKQEVAEEFIETYIADLKAKKSSSRTKTQPGDAFNSDLCRCRVWNKGYAKQCSSAHKEDGFCTAHNKKITEFKGWAFGHYDEEKPDEYLFDSAEKKTGHSLQWKEESQAPSKVLTPEIISLKTEYKKLIGRDPKGPKANDALWLQTKIDEYDPDEPEKKSSGKKVSPEVQALKDEYKKVFGSIPKGPKTNDAEWLKLKIKDQKIQSDSSNDEDTSSEEEEVKESDFDFACRSLSRKESHGDEVLAFVANYRKQHNEEESEEESEEE